MSSAGYQVTRIADANARQIQLDIWFPANGPETPHNYGISAGSVTGGATIAGDKLPLILLSHGAMGAASNYSWIAEALARRGYVVLGVSHFGESPVFGPATLNPATVSRFDNRTRDFKAALDWLLSNPTYAARIDANRIGLLGHSSGGATAMMLAGGRFSAEAMTAYCRSGAVQGDKGCQYPPGNAASAAQPVALGRPVRAIVAMDPAVGPGFDRQSLSGIAAPALVIGSVDNDFLPFPSHAGRYAELLPKVESIRLDKGEGHFVYIDTCSVPIEAMGIPICSDRAGVDRAAIHQRLSAAIISFFDKQLR